MMNNRTGVVLVYVDPATNYYARYEGCAGRVARLSNAVKAERPLTQGEVEELRAQPEKFIQQPEEPRVA